MKYRPTRPIETSYSRTTWEFVDFPPDTTVQDLLDPAMWCHVSKQWFRLLDEIIVIPQSAPFRAHFIVLDKGDTFAKLKLLDVTPLNDGGNVDISVQAGGITYVDMTDLTGIPVLELPANAPISVEWKGPHLKYSVIRNKDNERLKTGFAIKAEAEKWAAEHLLAMA